MEGLTTAIADALRALREGKLVVVPTDTVYGVAADVAIPGAVDSLFAAKSRSTEKALPILAASVEDLTNVVRFDERAYEFARRYWPGPLTLVLPRAEQFNVDLGGVDTSTIAVRIPAHDATLQLLAVSGPLAVSSANLSGRAPAINVEEARAELGSKVDVYVDGGTLEGGPPSTVLSLVGAPRIVREGVLSNVDLRIS